MTSGRNLILMQEFNSYQRAEDPSVAFFTTVSGLVLKIVYVYTVCSHLDYLSNQIFQQMKCDKNSIRGIPMVNPYCCVTKHFSFTDK